MLPESYSPSVVAVAEMVQVPTATPVIVIEPLEVEPVQALLGLAVTS